MREVDDLYELVHSLDRNEQRYFKMFLNRVERKNTRNAEILYDIIKRQKEYNADKIIAALKKKGVNSSINYERHQLFNQLLDFLTFYHRNNDFRTQLNNMLSQIDILYQKELFSLAEKITKKGLDLSIEKKLKSYTYKFCFKWLDIIEAGYEYDAKKWESAIQQLEKYANDYFSELNYSLLYKRVYQLAISEKLNDNSKAKYMLEPIISSKYFQEESLASTFYAKDYLYTTKSVYYQAINKTDQALEYLDKNINLYEDNPEILLLNIENYISCYFSYLLTLNDNLKFEQSCELLQESVSFPAKYKEVFNDMQLSFFYTCFYSSNINTFVQSKNYDLAYHFIAKHKEEINTYILGNYEERRKSYYTEYIETLFAIGKYNEMHDIYNQFIEDINLKQYSQSHFYCKLYYILSLHESDQKEILMPQFDSIYYLSRTQKIEGPFEKICLQIIRKISAPMSNKALQEFCQKSLTRLAEIDPKYLSINGDLLKFWLMSKAESKNLSNIIKKHKYPLSGFEEIFD